MHEYQHESTEMELIHFILLINKASSPLITFGWAVVVLVISVSLKDPHNQRCKQILGFGSTLGSVQLPPPLAHPALVSHALLAQRTS